MRKLFCTTGTSIAGGLAFDGNPNAYRDAIRKRLASLESQYPDPSDFLRRASAETNSLVALEAAEGDSVFLLCTETEDGTICAEEAGALLDAQRHLNCQVQKIEGLQVADASRFRRVGAQNLFATLDRLCGESAVGADADVVLNVTGGFKSVVPYVTLFGLLHRLPVVYLFERSKSLLRLPPVPVNFDYERLGQAMDALALLEREGAIPREKFFQAIPGLDFHGRDWYECLLEEDGGLVTISGFGSLLLKSRAREQAQVFLGPSARTQYESSSGLSRKQFTFMLDRAGDPLWRKAKVHNFVGTNLTVFKPGNTSERMACIVRGARVYVCELLQHDQYERILPSKRAERYSLGEFVPWVRPTDTEPSAATEEEAYRELHQRNEEINTCWVKAEGQLTQCQTECGHWRFKAEASSHQAAIAEEALTASRKLQDQSNANLTALTAQVESLQAALLAARRPWWKRLFSPG